MSISHAIVENNLSHAFDDALAKALKERSTSDYLKNFVSSMEYQELEASVYLTVLKVYLQNSLLLPHFEATLGLNKTVSSGQLSATQLAARGATLLSGAIPAARYLSILNKLLGWIEYRGKTINQAPVRFIVGIIEATFAAIQTIDQDKIIYLRTIQTILQSVAESKLTETWAIGDRMTIGAESLMHYKTQTMEVSDEIKKIIIDECVAQVNQEISHHIQQVKSGMENIPGGLLIRLIYNLYAQKPMPNELDYHGFSMMKQSEHITSLITVGLQSGIGLDNPVCGFCYKKGSMTANGEKINFLNQVIRSLQGDRVVQMNGSVSQQQFDFTASAKLIQTLSYRISEHRLVLNKDGTVSLYKEAKQNSNEKPEVEYSFPSGFSLEIIGESEQEREIALQNYVEILVLIQQLQNCMQLNQSYSHFLSKCGELGAFAMLPVALHDQMESVNKEAIESLRDTITRTFENFNSLVKINKTAAGVAKYSAGEERHKAITQARILVDVLNVVLNHLLDEIGFIKEKREKAMVQISENKLSYEGNTCVVFEACDQFSEHQRMLKKGELSLTLEDKDRGVFIARQLDSVRQQQPVEEKKTAENQPLLGLSSSCVVTALLLSSQNKSNVLGTNDDPFAEEVTQESKKTTCKTAYVSSRRAALKDDILMTKQALNAARVQLKYDKVLGDYEPDELFSEYNLREYVLENEAKTPLENFKIQIECINNKAIQLQKKRTSWGSWLWSFIPGQGDSLNHTRAACMVLCNVMCDVFEQTIKNGNDTLTVEDIKEMHSVLAGYVNAQKEKFSFWHKSFNDELQKLSNRLQRKKSQAIFEHQRLNRFKDWIRKKITQEHSTLGVVLEDIKQQFNEFQRVSGGFSESCLKNKVIQKFYRLAGRTREYYKLVTIRDSIQDAKNQSKTFEEDLQYIVNQSRKFDFLLEDKKSLKNEVKNEFSDYVFKHSAISKELEVIDKKIAGEIERLQKASAMKINNHGDILPEVINELQTLQDKISKIKKDNQPANSFVDASMHAVPLSFCDQLIECIDKRIVDIKDKWHFLQLRVWIRQEKAIKYAWRHERRVDLSTWTDLNNNLKHIKMKWGELDYFSGSENGLKDVAKQRLELYILNDSVVRQASHTIQKIDSSHFRLRYLITFLKKVKAIAAETDSLGRSLASLSSFQQTLQINDSLLAVVEKKWLQDVKSSTEAAEKYYSQHGRCVEIFLQQDDRAVTLREVDQQFRHLPAETNNLFRFQVVEAFINHAKKIEKKPNTTSSPELSLRDYMSGIWHVALKI